MADPDDSPLVRERRAKLARVRGRGVEPYPWAFPGREPTRAVVAACGPLAPGTSADGPPFSVAGRLRTIRQLGKTSFLDLEDQSGPLQLFLKVDEVGDAAYEQWISDLDPGDLVGAVGTALVTRRGEPSLLVRELTLLAKALSPPPEKFHGLQDPEARIRRRYVDLFSSEESRTRFTARSLLVREMRRHLDSAGFLEVETNTLLRTASGAAAKPFLTHSNYLGDDLQLRISLELALKRLLVGGMERVYEIGHVFRNEDLDSIHSPEFTLLELYWAYADYTDMRHLVEALYQDLAGRLATTFPELAPARAAVEAFRPPFATVDWVAALESASGLDHVLDIGRERLASEARRVGATVRPDAPVGKFLDKLFEHYVEPTLDKPTFVLDYPAATSPLAKRHRSLAGRIERFELFYRGIELGNAYTELNDPDEQERRFREQLGSSEEEHYALDEDFVEAMRYGMPPATGLGIGVDRLVMALLGVASIKDVILFLPTRERDGGS
ncbi:MAG TPA: lysine--tRNA ligase [Thermoplasmata archaeon]|nr:lysine--tRNA ligase [Thermoplasmata archaeon]